MNLCLELSIYRICSEMIKLIRGFLAYFMWIRRMERMLLDFLRLVDISVTFGSDLDGLHTLFLDVLEEPIGLLSNLLLLPKSLFNTGPSSSTAPLAPPSSLPARGKLSMESTTVEAGHGGTAQGTQETELRLHEASLWRTFLRSGYRSGHYHNFIVFTF